MLKSFSVVTLGCAKNEVDSEFIIGIMQNAGFKYEANLEKSQIIIVNTCAFLESSVMENLDVIFSLESLKDEGKLKKLIVAGCLVHRYKKDLVGEFPKVDAFVSSEEYANLPKIINNNLTGIIYKNFESFLGSEKLPRVVSYPKSFAYIKIAEGCNHACSYCTISKIKGKLKSRTISSIVKEAKSLASQGVKEINLVAQDLSAYGKDIQGNETSLVSLMDALHKAKLPCMFRLLYLYPTGITDALLSRIVEYDDFYNYIDLPLQHVSENILSSMKRPVGKFLPQRIMEKIHTKYPSINVRTTFIVGYPNETSSDVEELKSFIAKGYFSSVGFFPFSMEEETSAYKDFLGFVQDEKTTKKKIKELEVLQQKIRIKELKKLKGQTIKVILDSCHEETDCILVGRTEFQAPDVDGRVLITDSCLSKNKIVFGNFYNIEITSVRGYDLEGKIIDAL